MYGEVKMVLIERGWGFVIGQGLKQRLKVKKLLLEREGVCCWVIVGQGWKYNGCC